MRCKILHESRGRMRIHVLQNRITPKQADKLEYYLMGVPEVTDAKVFDRTGDVIICYLHHRQAVVDALSAFSYAANVANMPEETGRTMNRYYEDRLVFSVLRRGVAKLFVPMPLRVAMGLFQTTGYLHKGLKALLGGRLDVSVLDAIAISVSMVRRDYDMGGSIMFMLGLGDILEEWTRKKTAGDLARTMSLQVDNVWLLRESQEYLTPLHKIQVGDKIVVRSGNMIPLDGNVVSGEASVNQATITGESLPVQKGGGSYVYAGTVVEQGACVISVDKNSGNGRYDRIIRMIEESEKLKSHTEDRASHLADRLVPYSLLGTALTYLLTKNITKALSVLMVDFSCALKLSMPIAVLSAMREANYYNISIKGGRFLEAVSEADTAVFDKTGTLTCAVPKVTKVVAFQNRDENEMLRLAACLEEHYPHSIANAVVAEAKLRGLCHEECHSHVDYVMAHGISSVVDGEKVIIGSHHFVFQDEGCQLDAADQGRYDTLPDDCSHLFLAVGGRLVAVICIADPLRAEASAVMTSLRKLGLKKLVMITGDNDRTARLLALEVGVDEYYAEVLPEDKANFIRGEHEAGRKVIMLGDGVNDAPALSEADAGIAISDGAAIAREVADITISSNDLFALVTLKMLSDALMKRINKNYQFIMSFNLFLITMGVFGILPPTYSAFLHNVSTLGISLHGMTNLLD